MSLRDRVLDIQWTLRQRWFGIWEVRNYYTLLEQRAKAGARITFGYVLMALASAVLATGGLLLNSPAVVIGSMCVGPFLSPSRAVCIGGLFHDRRAFLNGLIKQLLGLLFIGTGAAYIITLLLRVSVPGIEITPEVMSRAMPAARDVVLTVLVAVAAGAAASLALTADPRIVQTPWGQVLDAMIGAEITISLIPPASVIGIGLAFERPDVSRNAFLLLMVNVLGLDILGSMLILALRGIRRQYLLLEKAIHQLVESAVAATPGATLKENAIEVTLLSSSAVQVHVTVRELSDKTVPDSLAQTIADEIKSKTDCRSEVTVDIVPSQTHATL